MYLKTVQYAQSNYGSNVYEVIGIPDGVTLGNFIKELDKYHDHMNNNCSIDIFDSEETSKRGIHALHIIDIPWRKDVDISNLNDEWLELPICCHKAIGFWGANTYYVYPYGEHTELPIREKKEKDND